MARQSKTCSACLHDGSCDHYCGGDWFSPVVVDCADCGRPLNRETDDFTREGTRFYCPSCAEKRSVQ